jgi:methyl-accepting chemotaxis protein
MKDLDTRAAEIASSLQKGNFFNMTPITLTAVAGVIVYVIFVFQGLRPPEGISWPFFMGIFLLKLAISFAVIGGTNLYIFWAWVRRELLRMSRVLAWDGNSTVLPEREAMECLLALLDFPHRFASRSLVQLVITSPILVFSMLFFFAFPVLTMCRLSLGVISIMCLMSIFHYFKIKGIYSRPLSEALVKFNNYYERPELATKRIRYGTKIFIYIVVLVGSTALLTTHLSFIGQIRSADLQSDDFMDQRVGIFGADLKRSLARGASPTELEATIDAMLGGNVDQAYLLDERGVDRLGKVIPALDQAILNQIPGLSPAAVPASIADLFRPPMLKRIFSPYQCLVVRITDRVLHAFADRKQFVVTVDPFGDRIRLVTIKPQEKITAELMAPIFTMFVVALVLSSLFAYFMQGELLNPLQRVIESSKAVAAGDLRAAVPIMADDEMGELATHHLRMVANIRAMVSQIAQASAAIESASAQIADRTGEMTEGSEAQSVGVEETSAALAEMNQTIGNIAESVDTLAASAEQSSSSILGMSATNEEVAAGAERLSAAVEETTASIQQMSASIRQVAENVQSTSGKAGEAATGMRLMRESLKQVDRTAAESTTVADQVTRDAESGENAVEITIQGIDKIQQASREAAEVIERLAKRARQIGRILTVIDEVTDETNLLALNAAIIAAQAGEHGRGFAVVADEIKDLAERTQASTSEITEQIRAVQDDARNAVISVERGAESVGEGMKLSAEAGQALRQILESAQRSRQLARKISEATQEQSRQSDRSLAFFENIAVMIDEIGAATQEQSRGSDQIILAAEKMRDIAMQVRKATREQAVGSRQISLAIEHVTHISNYINNSQSEQRKSAQQALQAMSSIADIATRNVEGVDKVSQAVSNLQVLADNLKVMLDTFRTDENGK